MQTTPNRFGINMTRFMKEHEAYLLSQMQALDAPHYFRLENTIQRWYTFGNVLMRRNLEGKNQP